MSDVFKDLVVHPLCEDKISVLYEDSSFLLIAKPTRLLSVPGRHPLNCDAVLTRLQMEYPLASIVHRLDYDTSGIMIIPLGKAALSNISKQFQARTIKKMYTAVLDGILENDSGVVELPIAPDPDNRPKYKICFENGKKSITEFSVLSRDKSTNTTRVQLHPITGRSHQLRLHMQAIGHSILGCEFYAAETVKNKAGRLMLHATELEFSHPVTGARVTQICKPDF